MFFRTSMEGNVNKSLKYDVEDLNRRSRPVFMDANINEQRHQRYRPNTTQRTCTKER